MTVAFKLSTTGMAVGVLVDGNAVGVKVSVGGGARVGAGVSRETGVMVGADVLGVSMGLAEGRVQAVSAKIRAKVVSKFFIAIYE